VSSCLEQRFIGKYSLDYLKLEVRVGSVDLLLPGSSRGGMFGWSVGDVAQAWPPNQGWFQEHLIVHRTPQSSPKKQKVFPTIFEAAGG
jgi:hypothetical protein